MKDISNYIYDVQMGISNVDNHRYRSWEHCYSYFSRSICDIDEEEACLHLSFYLASWGMYRGSSFLLWKDYLIHLEVVNKILEYKKLQNLDFATCNIEATAKEMFDLIFWIKNWYSKNIGEIKEFKNKKSGAAKKINVSNTLVTKILLGTLGCIPAYDIYFVRGLQYEALDTKLTSNNFIKIVKFYQQNKDAFDAAQKKILESDDTAVQYPIMKLIDMYFWNMGMESVRKL